jgi:hypothetical protein
VEGSSVPVDGGGGRIADRLSSCDVSETVSALRVGSSRRGRYVPVSRRFAIGLLVVVRHCDLLPHSQRHSTGTDNGTDSSAAREAAAAAAAPRDCCGGRWSAGRCVPCACLSLTLMTVATAVFALSAALIAGGLSASGLEGEYPDSLAFLFFIVLFIPLIGLCLCCGLLAQCCCYEQTHADSPAASSPLRHRRPRR